MAKVRCKDCQYFDGISKCGKYEKLGKRNVYDECICYEHTMNYGRSNHRDTIEDVVNNLANLVEEEKCFIESEENYKLEMLTRKLMNLVESHGVNSWKYDD